MPTSDRVLLVEGNSDKSFFDALLGLLALPVVVSVAPPREVGGQHNSKQGVYNVLPKLLERLAKGDLHALGLVLDADHQAHGGGLQATVEQVNAVLARYGYAAVSSNSSPEQGYLAHHEDGLPPIGLWAMPDNASAGSLEDWIIRCRHPNEEALWQHAQQALDALPETRFNPTTQRAKADVATWLAWQKKPGEERYMLVKSLQQGTPLLDEQAPLYQGLCHWLKQVFAAPDAPPA